MEKQVIINKLKEYIDTDKFQEDIKTFYPGVLSDDLRKSLNSLLNESIERIINSLFDDFTKDSFLLILKETLIKFEKYNLDTEERERVCECFDKIREICNIDSTDGILNEWLYGFNPLE